VPLKGGTLPIVVERLEGWTSFPGQTFRPHRHDFQELLWLESGTGSHTIDGRPIDFQTPSVSVITRGQVHAFQGGQGICGFVVSFTEDLLSGWAGERSLLVFNYASGNQAFPIGEDLQRQAAPLLRLLQDEYTRAKTTGDLALLRPLVEALLVLVRRAVREANAQQLTGSADLARFLTLLERDFSVRHDVAHYARALHVSARHLSRLTQAALSKTAKGVIQDRRTLEARRLLSFTDASVKEIAERLGFSDPFHFSRAFKAAVGVSPQTFRTEWRTENGEGSEAGKNDMPASQAVIPFRSVGG